jgi:biotin carboxylase
MKRSILILGAGQYHTKAIEEIAKNGFSVIAADRNPNAPSKRAAHKFFPIDITDRKALLDLAKAERIDGVMPINDFGTPTAAWLAKQLGLIGNSEETAWLANDKGAMRERWHATGLPNPKFRVTSDPSDIPSACRSLGFPCVLKPTLTGGAGRGISVIRNEDDIAWAVEFATPEAKNGRFIIENFVEGTELTVEVVSINGAHTVLAMSDKVKLPTKIRVATSLNYSAHISETAWQLVEKTVFRALDALGFTSGLSHTEVILYLDHESVILVETGARPGGGHIFHPLIETVSGICAPAIFAAIMVGERPEIPAVLRRGGVYRFFTPPPGILMAVENWEAACAMAGVLDMGMTARVGEHINEILNSLQRPGFVVTSGKDRNEAIAMADAVEKCLKLVIK